jgi:hypothetical protein
VLLAALTFRPLWLVLGLANLAAGVVIALRPLQSQDLIQVVGWCRDWLINGVNPHPGPRFTTNYPPYAIVWLSPLATLPEGLLKATWAIGNVALAAWVAWLGVKLASERNRGAILVSGAFFLAWQSLRIGVGNGQFTLLVFACGLAAIATRSSAARGILLGVALIKPQVALPFVLWAMLEGSLISLMIAAVPVIVGTKLFALRLGESVFHVAALYVDVLRHELSGPGYRRGTFELRPLVNAVITQPAIADAANLVLIAGTFVLMVVVSRRMSAHDRVRFLLPLTCVWTLMSVYHPVYDSVLLWPTLVAMSSWQSGGRPKSIVVAAICAMQFVMVVDIPGLWWKLNGRPASPIPGGLIVGAIQHFDRLLVIALFATLVMVSTRRSPWRRQAEIAEPPSPAVVGQM